MVVYLCLKNKRLAVKNLIFMHTQDRKKFKKEIDLKTLNYVLVRVVAKRKLKKKFFLGRGAGVRLMIFHNELINKVEKLQIKDCGRF